jgi:signal transduction histidine kinase
MPLPPEKQRALREYALQLSSTLSDVPPASIRALAQEVICRLGELACVQHSHLILLQGTHESELFGSVIAEWSAVPMPQVLAELQNVRMQMFSRKAVQQLKAGAPFYSEFDETEHACSKMVSGLLRELGLHGYEMIPVISCGRLKAIVGLAQKAGPEPLDEHSLQMIQLTAGVFIRSLQLARREKKRRQKHQQWKQVVNGACDFALKVDPRLEIIEVIPFRQKKPPNVDGLLLKEFLSYSSCESVLEAVQAVSTTAQPRSIQFFAINASGRPCSYAARIEPPRAKSRRRDLTFYLTNNDLERAHEEELSSLREQLDRATRLSLLGNIATEFAHQLTQPLQAISNHLYTLTSRVQNNQPADTILSCGKNIGVSVEHAGAIITSLRDFVTNRRMTLSPVKLDTMIHHAIVMIGAQLDRVKARIQMSDPLQLLESESSPLVYVDPVQTTHVVINLLVNSIEACSSAGTEMPQIKVMAGVDENPAHVLIEISDNGPGISLDVPDDIFDRFFTTKSEGFGIGLAICRDVIERQHGHIRVRNNPERGCCFSFTLPLYTGNEAEEIAEEPFDEQEESEG